jgi:peptide-methionine (R)-S-oxide reductase
MMMHRRNFAILTALSLGALAAAGRQSFGSGEAGEKFEIMKSPEEWKKLLPPETFAVMREEATERPWTSALLEEHRKGTFICAACDLPLYASETKYESGTGWPSFFDVLPSAVGQKKDDTLFTSRTEVHCRRCGGHLGHVFEDGPQPTGLRYCMNGVSLKFVAA